MTDYLSVVYIYWHMLVKIAMREIARSEPRDFTSFFVR